LGGDGAGATTLLVIPARRESSPFLVLIFWAELSLTCGERPTFGSRPKVGKRLGAERGVLRRILRHKIPCASCRGGVAQTVLCSLRIQLREQSPAYAIHGFGARRREMRFNASRFIRLAHVLLRKRGDPSPRPFGLVPPRLRCSAPRTAPVIHKSVHPWTAPRQASLLWRAGCALTGPLWCGLWASGNCSCVVLPPASMPSPAFRLREGATEFVERTSVYVQRTGAHPARQSQNSCLDAVYRGTCKALLLILGPLLPRLAHGGKLVRVARRKRASSLHVHG